MRRPGRPAGLSNIPNDFALGNALPDMQARSEPRKVAVGSRVASLMLHNDDIAVAGLLPDELYRAFGCGLDLGAGGCCEVYPLVCAPLVQDGVVSRGGKSRADTREFHR